MNIDKDFLLALRFTLGVFLHVFGAIGFFFLFAYLFTLPAFVFSDSALLDDVNPFTAENIGVFLFGAICALGMLLYRSRYGGLKRSIGELCQAAAHKDSR